MTRKSAERSSRLPGFYKLTPTERADIVGEFANLTAEEKYALRHETLTLARADLMIENAVGIYGLPLGVAANFRINQRDYLIPMAVEETSVVAAVSHLAKLIREHGQLTTSSTEPIMCGQIQVVSVPDPEAACQRIQAQKARLLALANEQDPMLCQVGGGARELATRLLGTPRGEMLIVELYVDVRDAMGANAVNSMAEALAPFIEEITGGRVRLRIISNLADRRLARAQLEIAPAAFTEEGWDGEEVINGILDAYAFALADPYRAATHNKGIMNGIDAVVVATGNDWRAVEAGAHAYAARFGRYEPLTRWRRGEDGRLVGEIELPLAVGIAGGATKVHPTAQIALKILGVRSARELAEVAAAVGLVQNLAALRSLVCEGIQRGHMVLHARNIAISAGAVGDMIGQIAAQMVREGRIRFDRAREILVHMLRAAHEKAHELHLHVEEKYERKPPPKVPEDTRPEE